MFTGIVETMGTVVRIEKDRTNLHFTIESPISHELKIDQSVSHNGACLTVVGLHEGPNGIYQHSVTAIDETLSRTNLGDWQVGTRVNLERCLPMGGRLDGHIVQGHVDTLATCTAVEDRAGSWFITFRYAPSPEHILVDKGSVCINGVSLTVVNPIDDTFSVAIIPYTWEHTNFSDFKAGTQVNIEFDLIGKYIAKHLAQYAPHVRTA